MTCHATRTQVPAVRNFTYLGCHAHACAGMDFRPIHDAHSVFASTPSARPGGPNDAVSVAAVRLTLSRSHLKNEATYKLPLMGVV